MTFTFEKAQVTRLEHGPDQIVLVGKGKYGGTYDFDVQVHAENGLVEVRPQRGTFVKLISIREVPGRNGNPKKVVDETTKQIALPS